MLIFEIFHSKLDCNSKKLMVYPIAAHKRYFIDLISGFAFWSVPTRSMYEDSRRSHRVNIAGAYANSSIKVAPCTQSVTE